MGTADVTVIPANEATVADLDAIFATPGDPRRCWCQWFKTDTNGWSDHTPAERADLLRAQARPGRPGGTTTGLVAHVGDEPAGWVAVEPRVAYQRLHRSRVVWKGRREDRDDPDVWAITCFVVRPDFRGRGVTRALAAASVDWAREHGARALEAYTRVVEPGESCPVDELYVGVRDTFADLGFAEASRPTPKRAVMRLDL